MVRHPLDERQWSKISAILNRAHQHAAGGKKGAAAQAIGRSRGGLSTKVHLVVDALGLPLGFEITEGQHRCELSGHGHGHGHGHGQPEFEDRP